jgi:hypothetical protein
MKEKMRTAIGKLQRTGKKKGSLSFSWKSKDLSKSVTAKILLDSGSNMQIRISDVVGYNLNYIRSHISSTFNEVRNEVLLRPGEGDEIWTKESVSDLSPGDRITLGAGVYYFAVNSGIMDCGGRQLGQSRQATFRRATSAACSPGGSIMLFSIFRLL